MMDVFRHIGWLLVGIFIGFTFASAILYHQLVRRSTSGQEAGFNDGAYHVIRFLRQISRANAPLYAEARETGNELVFKYSRLKIITIKGVQTIRVDE